MARALQIEIWPEWEFSFALIKASMRQQSSAVCPRQPKGCVAGAGILARERSGFSRRAYEVANAFHGFRGYADEGPMSGGDCEKGRGA